MRHQSNRERARSRREDEPTEQRQVRLENERERTESNRRNEADEQRQVRVEQERKRSVENRNKTKVSRHNFNALNADQRGINTRFCERSKLK
jgi:hypothetical protein